MTPIEFKGQNVIFAKDQPEYQPLPALVIEGNEGEVISCWQLTDEELERLNKTKCIYLSQLCFTHIDKDGNQRLNPLQPILPMVELGDNITLI
jgi:hypothetical protein